MSQTKVRSVRGFSSTASWCLVGLVVYGALFAAGARRAHAQVTGAGPDAAFRATRGVFIPGAVRAGDADATAVELNPGQLPLLTGSTLSIAGNFWRAQAAMPGRGAGLFFAAPLWAGSGLGIGLQGIGSSTGSLPGHGKFQLAYGLGGRTFGIGVSWAHLFGGGLGGVDTFDVGFGWRPLSIAAIAVVAEDIGRPRVPGAADRLSRRWVGELALRPLGTNRFELAFAGLHAGDDAWSRFGMRFRLLARLSGALAVFADLEREPLRLGTAALPASDAGTDWRATAGLALDFDHATLLAAARRAFTPSGVGGDNAGGAILLHVRGDRNPRGLGGGDVVRVTLDNVDSDREFLELALRLRGIAGNSSVAAVLLRVEGVEVGMGRIEELRDLISEIRQRGKPVIAYLTQASTRELYIASACDRVIMHPAGALAFAGLSNATTFYKGAMDRLGVAVDLVRIAEYKGAMEPYIMTEQSAPVRQNRNDLLDDVYGRILAAIASDRRERAPAAAARTLDVSRMNELVAVAAFTPEQARDSGLIDDVRDDNELQDALKILLQRDRIEVRDPDPSPVRPGRWARRRVAVILIDGTIADGPNKSFPMGLGGVAGADTLVDALEECRRDPDVRAVVLRVNSPGGSAFSSDVLARAISKLRAAGKPVVTSMGDVAASGGYYVAAPTDVIFAEPSTTTGSIGIFGFKLDLSRLLAMLSIHVEVTRRGPHADQLAPYRPWTAEERVTAEKGIRHLYELFLNTVATGRKSRGLTRERVDAVGRGHVWTGAQARTIGLVDEIGGVTAAITRAATMGNVRTVGDEPPDLLVLPRSDKNILQAALGLSATVDGISADANARPARLARPLRAVLQMAAPYLFGPSEGIEARLPFDLDIR
jgi:protease-4